MACVLVSTQLYSVLNYIVRMDVKKLIEALRNKDVVDAFASALQPTILVTMTDLKSSIDELRKEIITKDSIISCLSVEVNTLKEENDNLSTSLANCRDRLDLLETYTRVDNLIIKGIPERYAEAAATNASVGIMANNSHQQQWQPDENSDTTMSLVIDFCSNTLGTDIQLSDISIAHRMPKGKHDKMRPVMVRFTNRRIRDTVYRARRKLRGSNAIYINEHLTKQNDELFLNCRQLKKQRKVHSTWTWHGISYVKCSESSRAIKIANQADLDKLRIN